MTFAVFTRWVWLAGLLVLSGCATRPPVSPADSEANWLAHQAALETLTHWRVQGRIAVRTDSEGWSANFDWKQQGEDYRIRVRGPFGQGAVELHGNGRGVWLKRADQPPVFALNPEALLEQETGWQLPVEGLSSWLRGLPVPGGSRILPGMRRAVCCKSIRMAGRSVTIATWHRVICSCRRSCGCSVIPCR